MKRRRELASTNHLHPSIRELAQLRITRVGEIGLRAPIRHDRGRAVLAVPFTRTTQVWHAPLVTMIREYNALTEVQPDLDVFHGTRVQFGELVGGALDTLYS